MTETARKLKNDPRGKILAEIRTHLKERERAQQRTDEETLRVYINVYLYVQAGVSLGAYDTGAGVLRLAEILRMKRHTVMRWYYVGRFASIHRINPTKTKTSAVMYASHRFGQLSKFEQTKVMKAIKDGQTRHHVERIFNQSGAAVAKSAERKATRLKNANKLTKTVVKMSAMALVSLAKTFYDKDVIVDIYDAETKDVLLSAK